MTSAARSAANLIASRKFFVFDFSILDGSKPNASLKFIATPTGCGTAAGERPATFAGRSTPVAHVCFSQQAAPRPDVQKFCPIDDIASAGRTGGLPASETAHASNQDLLALMKTGARCLHCVDRPVRRTVNVRGADCLKAEGGSPTCALSNRIAPCRLLAAKQWRSPATALICTDDDSAELRGSCARNGHGAPAFCHNGRNATPCRAAIGLFLIHRISMQSSANGL